MGTICIKFNSICLAWSLGSCCVLQVWAGEGGRHGPLWASETEHCIALLPRPTSLPCGPPSPCPACCQGSLIQKLIEITRALGFDPAISPPGIYPTEILALVPNDRGARMSLAVLFLRAPGHLDVCRKGSAVCVSLSDSRVPENVLNTLHGLTHLTLAATFT